MTRKVLLGGGVVAVAILLLLTLNSREEQPTYHLDGSRSDVSETDTTVRGSDLLVLPQQAVDVVEVKSAILTKSGFLAVRAVDGNRLGQIVEISEYLTADTYNNVSIPLGEFYEGDEELMVMIYEDIGNDQIFNDLDQPYKENNTPVAVYVATGEKVPESIVTNTGAPEGISLMIMGTMEFVSYTDNGFEPRDLLITRGTMVHFVNESSIDMWVASDDHPAHTVLPTFDQFKGSPPGEQYVYIFDQAGEWNYHDHLTPTAVGTITVTN